MNIIEKLLNQASQYPSLNQEKRIDLANNGQHPEVALLCCSDSRVIPEDIFNVQIGDIFVIRTAGNTLGENEEASFGYAYHHLHIKEFIVLGHTRCGAISSTLNGEHCCIFDQIASHIGQTKDPTHASILNVLGVSKELRQKFVDVNVTPLLYDIETGSLKRL